MALDGVTPLNPSPPQAEQSSAHGSGSESADPESVEPAAWWSRGQLWAHYNALRGDAYALDDVERRGENRATCSPASLVPYRGTVLSFGGAPRVHPAFAERLQRFETVVQAAALEVYGRAPRRVVHFGAYACRNSRFRSQRLSEHALGNAIDVAGFDFSPADKAQRELVPKSIRWGFQVRVDKHFNASKGEAALLHRKFLRLVAQRVVDEGVFRVVLGPSHRGHENHFHFDMSPWSYVHL